MARILEESYCSVNHLENFILDSVEILGVASRSAANNIVDFDVIVLAAHASYTASATLRKASEPV